MRSDFAKNSLILFGALVLASILNYGFYLLLGHTLAVAEYGAVVSLIAVVSLVTTPAALGQTIVAKIVSHRSPSAGTIPEDLVRATFAVAAGVGVTIAAGGFFLRFPIARFLHLERSEDVTITAIATALGVVLFLGRGLLQGAQLFRAFALSNIIDGALRLFIGLFAAKRFGVTGALATTAIAMAMAFAYGAIIVYRRRDRFARTVHETAAATDRGVASTAALSFVLIALGFYDPILVKHYLGAVDAGAYGVLSLAGRTIGIVLSFVPVVVLPNVVKRTAVGSPSRGILAIALAVAGGLALTSTLACWLASPLIVSILAGPAFAFAAPLLALYVGGASFLALAAVIGSYLIGKHDFRSVLPLTCVAAVEVLSVTLRHATMADVVQDVFVGHAAIAMVMLVAVAARGRKLPLAAAAT